MKKIAYLLLIILSLSNSAFAQQAFVIKRIEIDGLQHINQGTVENYLPVKRGQTMRAGDSAAVVRALYKTGFFEQITLSRSDSTLVIHVVERPTIGQLKISGNSVIPTDKLTQVMKSLDVSEGRVYNPEVITKIKQSLLNQYYQLGRYNARVDINVSSMPRNRVLVKIDISEGLVAKVQRISIIGNHVFEEKTLIKQLVLTTSGVFTIITQTDRYSEEKLEASLEKLRSYYMDRGYLHFEVKSAQGQISPDRKAVYVTIVVSEGEPYRIEKYELTGDLVVPPADLEKHIDIKRGDLFNRQKVLDAEKAISKEYGDKGYVFASIALQPRVNEANHTVVLVFNIKSGRRAYVRHLTFSDNTRTNDVVLRRELAQMEAAPASTALLEESKHRLLMLPYIKEAEMSIKPVPDVTDQIDVNYKVKEDTAAQASFKLGYSQVYRTIIGAGLNQKNFLGTGNTFGINLTRSKYEQFYSIEYTNPYYTPEGISRSFSLSVSRTDPGAAANVVNSYTADEIDLGVIYGIPLFQEHNAINRLVVGGIYQNTMIHLNKNNPNNAPSSGSISNQVASFVDHHGRHFQEADFRLGYARDSRDKAMFATRGSIQSLYVDFYAPLDSNSIAFYTLNYHGKFYRPLSEQFIMLTKADLGYGNGVNGIGSFPFFRNYFAGGIDSVRGYEGYTLGPRDSNGQAFGGNMLAYASLALIFPNYISDNLRTSLFLDGGNVYSSLDMRAFGGSSTTSGPIRYSFGIEADWLTPFGPVELALGKAINAHPGDKKDVFQFSLGANF